MVGRLSIRNAPSGTNARRRPSYSSYNRAIEKKAILDGIEPVVLGCLRKDGLVRGGMIRCMMWSGTHAIVGAVVWLLCCALCAYDPLNEDSQRNSIIQKISLATTCFFAVEMVVKVVSLGLWGRTGYLKDPWSWVDVGVVVLGFASEHPAINDYSSLRFLRLVRWISVFPGMNIIFRAVFRAIPGVLSVLMVTSLTYIVWGLIAVQLWAGLLQVRRCWVDYVRADCCLHRAHFILTWCVQRLRSPLLCCLSSRTAG
jgi:hypothetical protein